MNGDGGGVGRRRRSGCSPSLRCERPLVIPPFFWVLRSTPTPYPCSSLSPRRESGALENVSVTFYDLSVVDSFS